MRRLLVSGILSLLLFGMTGCVTSNLTQRAAHVRVTSDPEEVASCRFIKIIHQRALMPGLMHDTREVASRKLQEQAAGLGGNVVLVVGESGTATSGTALVGRVYACP